MPENPDNYIVWAVICMQEGKLDEALAAAKIGIGFNPDTVGHYVTLSSIYAAMGDKVKARSILADAYKKCVDVPSINWNYSLALLEAGFWKLGWDLYRWRKVYLPGHIRFLQPEWNKDCKDDVTGKRLLVWSEQGLGDNVMMFRYLKQLKEKFGFGEVILECSDELYTLFCRHTTGIDDIYVRRVDWHTPHKFDYHCSMLDLPYSLELRPEDESGEAYLTPSPVTKELWTNTIKENKLKGKNIGICWQGSVGHANNKNRSLALKEFAPLFALGNIFAVQKETQDSPEFDPPEGCQLLGTQEGIVNADFTSGLLCSLDCVVTIDSFVAHLAGSLGVKTYLILPHSTEWRWMGGEGKSVWYKSVEMIRQPKRNDWASVIKEVCKRIK